MLREQGLGRVPNNVTFLDPLMCNWLFIQQADLVALDYLTTSLNRHADKDSLLAAINVG